MDNQQFVKAHWILRIVAFFIDHMFLVCMLWIAILTFLGSDLDTGEVIEHYKVLFRIILLIFASSYICKDLFNGLSIGRWLVGIVVRNEHDYATIPSPFRLILRNLFILILPIEVLILVFNPNHKRIGDWLAKNRCYFISKESSDSVQSCCHYLIHFRFFWIYFLFSKWDDQKLRTICTIN